ILRAWECEIRGRGGNVATPPPAPPRSGEGRKRRLGLPPLPASGRGRGRGRSSVPAVVDRRGAAGAADVVLLRLLLARLFGRPTGLRLAAAAALSLRRQGQPLQLPEVHPGEPDGRLEVLLVPTPLLRVGGLLGQQ